MRRKRQARGTRPVTLTHGRTRHRWLENLALVLLIVAALTLGAAFVILLAALILIA